MFECRYLERCATSGITVSNLDNAMEFLERVTY